jgi:hypothetical protein
LCAASGPAKRRCRRRARLPDARAYSEAARADFQSFGDRAAQDIQNAEQLITKIDQAMVKSTGQ